MSPVPDSKAWVVDALCLSWDDLDQYAFPPSTIMGKVVEKLRSQPCKWIIVMGWPNMPWFGDLVDI